MPRKTGKYAMICSLCTGVAWWQVGSKGFCAAHKAEAQIAAKKDNKIPQGRQEPFRFAGRKG